MKISVLWLLWISAWVCFTLSGWLANNIFAGLCIAGVGFLFTAIVIVVAENNK